MSLTLTCLGGAAAWPNPGQGCSAFLVSDGSTNILLDAGPNTLSELRKHILYSTIDAVIVSHCHSDHILDLIPYRYGLTYGHEKPATNIPLWLPPGGKETLGALSAALGGKGEPSEGFWQSAFDMREYDPSKTLETGGLRITFVRTDHAAECYAMRVATVDAALTYSADTGSIEPLLGFADGSELLIAEATLPESDERQPSAGHLMPSEAGRLAADTGAGKLVLTHLWSERPDADVLSAARARFEGQIHIAKPGLVIDA